MIIVVLDGAPLPVENHVRNFQYLLLHHQKFHLPSLFSNTIWLKKKKKKEKNRKIDKRPTYESSRPMEAVFISQKIKKKERMERERERGGKKEIYTRVGTLEIQKNSKNI